MYRNFSHLLSWTEVNQRAPVSLPLDELDKYATYDAT